MPALNWIGKDAVEKHHVDVPYRLLEPIVELSVGDEHSGNLIVQGDNLHALKALLPRYAGRVKCIYIDPPYNTGNEKWIYNDNVNSPEIRKWLGEVVGKEGDTLDRHDRWLCLMYPRLLLLKKFLTEDGVIFVSIDDHAIHYLRSLMDEIFGIKNRLESFVWRTDGNFDNQAKIKNCHEYILMYSKNAALFPHPKVVDPSVGENSKLNKSVIRNTIVKNGPKNPISTIVLPAGFPCSINEAFIPKRNDAYPHYDEDLVIKEGKLVYPVNATSGWSSKNILLDFINNDLQPVFDSKNQLTEFVITHTGAIESIKMRNDASHVVSVINGVGSTQSQKNELEKMGFKFDYPKPVDLIRYLISMVNGDDFLVMDSFAGSGSTAHAVLKQNHLDNGTRKFILVELEDKIAETVTTKRISMAINGYEFTGKQKNIIYSHKLTLNSLQKSENLLEKLATFQEQNKDIYSNIKTVFENGTVSLVGEINITDKTAPLGGGFQYCTLSNQPLFCSDGHIRSDVTFKQLAEFVWFSETGIGYTGDAKSPLLGVFEGRAIYLLYNGILKDFTEQGGNVLTKQVYEVLPKFEGTKVVYAAANRLGMRAKRLNIIFKQTPYSLEI
ncbi:MAG: site-specific DNA-methyltransferase [Alcaligenaceae bacterium]|nr:site-specific DNA-methyltransferase [Alcaligenaceae bacterium]